MVEFWAELVGPGQTLFGELETLCGQIAALCDGYGRLVEDTHGAIREGLGIMLTTGALLAVTGVGLLLAAHVGLAEIELFLNPAADAFAARLPGTLTAVDPGLGGTVVPPAPESSGPATVNRFDAVGFASPVLSAKHVGKHAAEFGLTTEAEYVGSAQEFLRYAQELQYPTVIDDEGIVRVYDPESNTLASYDSTNGVIKTYFKPTSETYWDRNVSDWGDPVVWE